MLTRIAPTPSGFVHQGNCFNFLVTNAVAEQRNLQLALRIDVDDRDRVRPAYVNDIFRVLSLLDIEPSIVMNRGEACEQRWRRMRTLLMQARENGLHLYSCSCSRRNHFLGDPCRCDRKDQWLEGQSIKIDAHASGVDPTFDGFVLWRRSDQPSSLLAGIIDDFDLGTTHIVRGEDLVFISQIESVIRPKILGDESITTQVLHHRLIRDQSGHKLSKSAGKNGAPRQLTRTLIDQLRSEAEVFVRSTL